MEITLYLEDREMILTDNLQDNTNLFHYDFTVIPALISKIIKNNLGKVYLFHPNPAGALKDIQKYFDVIEAAGGIVLNENNEVLFIYRRGVWDLPKGKMESGENAEDTAVREVKEECGLESVELSAYLTDTYHIFRESGRRKLKITHWYLMKASSNAAISPQTIEGIEKVAWLSADKLTINPDNKIYLSIKHLLERINFFG